MNTTLAANFTTPAPEKCDLDSDCTTGSVLPTYFTIIVLSLYITVVLLAAFTSYKKLLDKSVKFVKRLKLFFKDAKRKKKCYFEFVPHLIDIATDGAVIIEFYQIAAADNCVELDMWGIFYLSLCVALFYHLVSSILIYYYTKSLTQFILQLFDLELVRALIVNYRTGSEKPCRPQLWISNLEAVFESTPSSIIQLVYLLATNTLFGDDVTINIVQVSLVLSLFVIVKRNVSNDELMFENVFTNRIRAMLRELNIGKHEWHDMPHKWKLLYPFRCCDVFVRVILISMTYIVYPWGIWALINIVELIGYIIYAIKTKHFEFINAFIRVDLTKKYLILERVVINGIYILSLIIIKYFDLTDITRSKLECMYFWYDSTLYYFIIFVVFVLYINGICMYYFLIYKKMKWISDIRKHYFNETDIFHESTDIEHLVRVRRWKDILDLIYFGFNWTPDELLNVKMQNENETLLHQLGIVLYNMCY